MTTTTNYAQYNPAAPAPQPVLGWYDGRLTALYTRSGTWPPASELIAVSDDIWAERCSALWQVSNGAVVKVPATTTGTTTAS